MIISFDIDVTAKQADDIAAELIVWLINYPVEVLGYEVETS